MEIPLRSILSIHLSVYVATAKGEWYFETKKEKGEEERRTKLGSDVRRYLFLWLIERIILKVDFSRGECRRLSSKQKFLSKGCDLPCEVPLHDEIPTLSTLLLPSKNRNCLREILSRQLLLLPPNPKMCIETSPVIKPTMRSTKLCVGVERHTGAKVCWRVRKRKEAFTKESLQSATHGSLIW